MAQGDWHADSALRPTLVNLQLGPGGRLNHVGIGFDVLSPTGTVLAHRGFTWTIPPAHRNAIEAAMVRLLNDALAAEGLQSTVFPTFPDPTP